MRKVQFFASFWTIALAIPFTVLALVGAAYLTENLTQIINLISNFSRDISVGAWSGIGIFRPLAGNCWDGYQYDRNLDHISFCTKCY
jgi:hypothetical protein